MPFIGNQPALSYTSFAKQDFTTSATTSYTLDHPVTNENEIALFINFVRQEPTTAYTASGTSLTLTSATSASDDMYCVFLGKAVQTVNPPSGSVGTAQIADGARTTNLLYPAFSVRANAQQNLSDATETLVSFDDEVFDTDNCFDNTSSNYKFTPNVAGKYFLYFTLDAFSQTDDKIIKASGRLYKNGTRINSNIYNLNQSGSSGVTAHALPINQGFIVEANGSSDYFQVKIYIDVSSGSPAVYGNTGTSQNTTFFGYRIGA